MFVRLEIRRAFAAPPTLNPNSAWVMQQCRNVSMWLDDEGIDAKILIRDRDGKFPKDEMQDFWAGEECRVIKIPPKSPKASAFAESFIRSLERECLDWFMYFGLEPLYYLVRTWAEHYTSKRPHRGIGMDNEVLDIYPKI